ncbi:myelin-associated glycoprotein-like isoform X2 [Plectropomus leopardus]|nr:myelin-associated glycoprotein-like isoform X2 [Plectropomus leopardus]
MPKTIEVLSGSCVTIPCSFDIEDKYKTNLDNTCKAIWTHDKKTVVFDSSNPQQTPIKGNFTGDLKQKDCTTTLNNMKPADSNTYNFKLECDSALRYHFVQQVLNIVVNAHLPRPTLSPSTLEAKEGTSVSLRCSAPAPCLSHPPSLTWTPRLGDSQETLQENQDKTQVQTSVVTFTASHLHHGQTVSCTATYNKQDGSSKFAVIKSFTADISFAPQILLSSNCTKAAAQLTCSCETVGNPSPALQWYLDGLPLNNSEKLVISYEPLKNTSLRSIITVNQLQERDLSTLICHSSNSLGSATLRFFVYSPEPQTSAETCSGQVLFQLFISALGIASLLCALLFAFRFCRHQRTGCQNPTKTQSTSDTSSVVMTTENENKVSNTGEEDIYVNTITMRESNMPNTPPESQQVVSKSSVKKNEEDSDLVYSEVMWKSNKKKGEHNRNHVSYALEMGWPYEKTETGKDAETTMCSEYAQVHFRDKNINL